MSINVHDTSDDAELNRTLNELVSTYNDPKLSVGDSRVRKLENTIRLLRLELQTKDEYIHNLRIEYNEKIADIKENYINEICDIHDQMRSYVQSKLKSKPSISEILEDIDDHVDSTLQTLTE
jgi:hypothetical protein